VPSVSAPVAAAFAIADVLRLTAMLNCPDALATAADDPDSGTSIDMEPDADASDTNAPDSDTPPPAAAAGGSPSGSSPVAVRPAMQPL